MASTNKINERARYVRRLPRRKLPEGTFLVHNHIVPVKPLSLNGFRPLVQEGKDDPPTTLATSCLWPRLVVSSPLPFRSCSIGTRA
jgi:hypothetical protein